jgi:myo-inositol-1(or 4)-monophosphatase
METPLAFAKQLARQAGELLLQHFSSPELHAHLKADRSIVTQADVAADSLITAAIRRRFPEDQLMSEELQPDYTAQENQLAYPVWIIDPLDGTTNFSLGLHIWGVLLTRLVDGWPESTVAYFPHIDELYHAQRGQGAFLNGTPIHVQLPSPERPLSFFACCSRTFRRYQVSVPYKTRIMGSAAFSMCAVARGIAVLGFEATPRIWDIAGAWLLVSEAGGVVETLDGSQPFPLRPGVSYGSQSFPTLAAATPELAAKAHTQIQLKQPPSSGGQEVSNPMI